MSSSLHVYILQVPYFLSSASLVNRRQKLPLPDLSLTHCKFSSDANWLCVSLAIHRKERFIFLPSGETWVFSWILICKGAVCNWRYRVMEKSLFFWYLNNLLKMTPVCVDLTVPAFWSSFSSGVHGWCKDPRDHSSVLVITVSPLGRQMEVHASGTERLAWLLCLNTTRVLAWSRFLILIQKLP